MVRQYLYLFAYWKSMLLPFWILNSETLDETLNAEWLMEACESLGQSRTKHGRTNLCSIADANNFSCGPIFKHFHYLHLHWSCRCSSSDIVHVVDASCEMNWIVKFAKKWMASPMPWVDQKRYRTTSSVRRNSWTNVGSAARSKTRVEYNVIVVLYR